MPRIRTVKPEFWTSATIAKLSIPARLLFIALLNFADDQGRGKCFKREIAGFAFPYDDEVDVGPLLDELEAAGLIHRYEADNRPHFHVVSWFEHQRINRPTPSRLPAPPCCRSSALHEELSEAIIEDAVTDSMPRKAESGKRKAEAGNRKVESGDENAEAPAHETLSPPDASGQHPDASRLAALLADLIHGNGLERPAIRIDWLDEMTALLVTDMRPPLDVEGAIRFAQGNDFWRGVILHPKSLRRNWLSLLAQAQRASPGPRKTAAQSRFDAEMEEFKREQRLT